MSPLGDMQSPRHETRPFFVCVPTSLVLILIRREKPVNQAFIIQLTPTWIAAGETTGNTSPRPPHLSTEVSNGRAAANMLALKGIPLWEERNGLRDFVV